MKKKYDSTYSIKYKTFGYPYYHLVNGSFKIFESAMQKVEEIKADESVREVVLSKRTGYHHAKMYKWDNGFETIYLGR